MDGLGFLAIWFLGWFAIGVGIIALGLKVINHVKDKVNAAYEEDINRQKIERMTDYIADRTEDIRDPRRGVDSMLDAATDAYTELKELRKHLRRAQNKEKRLGNDGS
ncbi:MAG: hypothetical protein OXI94_08205 [Gemmatimonadota bacterium]|nr:hypothetical protein [Gemmatimonadota bacterium]MDE2955352.1 hypothetical protein [Gemmatimonadota bacterium]